MSGSWAASQRRGALTVSAVAAVHWLVIMVIVMLSGLSLAVQTVVAQSCGGRRRARASQSVWLALWGTLWAVPLFVGAAWLGRWGLPHLRLPAQIQQLTNAFWMPRVCGAPPGVAVFALLGFFNGVGRTRVTLLVTAVMAVSNAVLNQWFIFGLGWGIAGAGYATSGAQVLGLLIAMTLFLRPQNRAAYRSHLTWRWCGPRFWRQWRLGLPMGLLWAADLFGFSVFQLMQVRLGSIDGAATQLVMILTACAYVPGVGIAMAGTTVVGQSIGAGNRDWAFTLGNRIVVSVALFMGGMGVLLAIAGPWILPHFVSPLDPERAPLLALAARLLWLAAIYQFFDGLNLGSSFCLRGAGDAKVPALMVLGLSWCIFVPLAYTLTFAPGQGWFDGLPQLGGGAVGGWVAVVIYIALLGAALFWRWRARTWMSMRI